MICQGDFLEDALDSNKNSDVHLKPLWPISDALVVTAGFVGVELGPRLFREVRGTSVSRFGRLSPVIAIWYELLCQPQQLRTAQGLIGSVKDCECS